MSTPLYTYASPGYCKNPHCASTINLLIELPALLAVYSGTPNLRTAKSDAISFDKPHIVNLFSRQTLPTGRGIQISACGVSTLHNCPALLGLRAGLLISSYLCLRRLSYGASQEKTGSRENPRPSLRRRKAWRHSPGPSSLRNSNSRRSCCRLSSSCQVRRANDLFKDCAAPRGMSTNKKYSAG